MWTIHFQEFADLCFHTSKGSIGYTGDIRFHGRRESSTKDFIDKCGNSDIDILLCEGTRVAEDFSQTELC